MATNRMSDESSNDDLSLLWRSACEDYAKETGINIRDGEFPKLSGPEELSRQLDMEEAHFKDFRMKKRSILRSMQVILVPFETWGDLIGQTVAVSFPPAASITGAMLLLIQGARKVSESFDMITDLFQKLSYFALRLGTYKDVPLSKGMQVIIVKVMVNFLRVCAVSQKLLKAGSFKARLSKWAKNVFFEDTSITSLLSDLQELTNQENYMITAQSLNLTHQALTNTADLLERTNAESERERLDRVKDTLKPVSASNQVYSAIRTSRIPGSGSWIDDRIKSWWKSSQPILWLHGGPAVGKSYLASKIIDDLRKTDLPPQLVVASFFCKNNDVDLRSMNKALRTLAWHVATEVPDFAAHAEQFCLKVDPADTYSVWRELLVKFFIENGSSISVSFVIDGIDEADLEEQDLLFSLLEKTYSEEAQEGQPISLRFVLLSRDSVRNSLDEHLLGWVSNIEITNNENSDDLHGYISRKLQGSGLFKGSSEFLKEVITEIRESAEGLWEWANLVVKSVLRCTTKGQIRRVIKTMPRGIKAMLNQELQRLARQLSAEVPLDELNSIEELNDEAMVPQIRQLNLILSFVTIAQRPLTTEQLELILKIILDDEILNLEDRIRNDYSSLLVLRDAQDTKEYVSDDSIVTLRHSSFYEFFKTSAQKRFGPIHVDIDQAEIEFVFVLLYVIKSGPELQLWPVERYAHTFLGHHLTNASPEEKVSSLYMKISTLLSEMFERDTECDGHFIQGMFGGLVHNYRHYMSSVVTKLAEYWFGTGNYDTANERAQHVLKWLLPASRQIFEECARSAATASDACPFTILFSRLAVSWSQDWLQPDELEAHYGHPYAIPLLLNVYCEMASIVDLPNSDEKPQDLGPGTIGSVKKISSVDANLSSSRILRIAKVQQYKMTAIWHARVGQALLLHWHFQDGLDHFEKAIAIDKQSPTLSPESLSVVYEHMSRACFETGRYEEALKYNNLVKTRVFLRSLYDEDIDDNRMEILHVLNEAQMQYFAKLPDQAIETAHRAWETFLKSGNRRDWSLWQHFLTIFLDLEQSKRLREVFELGLSDFQRASQREIPTTLTLETFIEPEILRPRTVYKAIHISLTPGDEASLQLLAKAMEMFKESNTGWNVLPKVQYIIGTALFEKGQFATGIHNWYEAVTSESNPSGEFLKSFYTPTIIHWHNKSAQERSTSHLAAVCLFHPEIPFGEEEPLTLGVDAEFEDICLIISSWLRNNGDHANARKALCGRVKKCVEMLSDNDPSNDGNSWHELFKTFLVATDSDEDLSGALYMMKTWRQIFNRALPESQKMKEAIEALEGVQIGDDDTPRTQSTGQTQNIVEPNEEEKVAYDLIWTEWESVTACASCDRLVTSASYWYFCRSCPHTVSCPSCYGQIQSSSVNTFLSQHVPRTCNAHHEFYYTGAPLRLSECADQGMIRLRNTDSEDFQSLWVEEWKDGLAERWGTKDFAFEGGLSAWCMRVLPERQRERWATFFKV